MRRPGLFADSALLGSRMVGEAGPDDDEIVKAIRLTQGGKVVNERLTAD